MLARAFVRLRVCNELDFVGHHGRVLGLDVGTSNVGLALSCTDRRAIKSLGTISRRNWNLGFGGHKDSEFSSILKGLILKHHVSTMVVGLPLLASGEQGAQCRKTTSFVDGLDEVFQRDYHACKDKELHPVHIVNTFYWDERLSTHKAKLQIARHRGHSRHLGFGEVDGLAAQAILADFLGHASIGAVGAGSLGKLHHVYEHRSIQRRQAKAMVFDMLQDRDYDRRSKMWEMKKKK